MEAISKLSELSGISGFVGNLSYVKIGRDYRKIIIGTRYTYLFIYLCIILIIHYSYLNIPSLRIYIFWLILDMKVTFEANSRSL